MPSKCRRPFQAARLGLLSNRGQSCEIFFQRLILISTQKRFRNRARETECRDRPGRDRALRAFLIYNNADDLDFLRRRQLSENGFAVAHLRHRFGRDKTDRVEMGEARFDQRPEVLHFSLGRNLFRQTLPGVARTFDQLHSLFLHTRRVTWSESASFQNRKSFTMPNVLVEERVAPRSSP